MPFSRDACYTCRLVRTLGIEITGLAERGGFQAFRDFVARSSLPVVSKSIQKRDPPEPDIPCWLEDGNQLAFELVEICHPNNAAFSSGVGARTDLIERTYQNLPSDIRARFDGRFANTPLSFEFRPEA